MAPRRPGGPPRGDFDLGPDEVSEQDDTALLEAIERLSKLSTEEIARLAHRKTLILFLAKVETGTASAAELGHLKGMLKDNGMVLGVPPEGQEERRPPQAPLPSYDPPDYESLN